MTIEQDPIKDCDCVATCSNGGFEMGICPRARIHKQQLHGRLKRMASAQELLAEVKAAAESEVAKLAEIESAMTTEMADLQKQIDDLKAAPAAPQADGTAPAADSTPFSQDDIDDAVAEASDALSKKVQDLELELSKKDNDALEEMIADELAAMAQKMRDLTVKSQAPSEAPVATEA